MSAPMEDQDLPDTLVETLDDLDARSLRTVHTHVAQRLDDLRPSLREQIRSEAHGEIVDIQDCGAYTLVWKHPPSEGDSERASRPLSLYRLRREKQLNGEETLHWAYLGDVTKRVGVEYENRSTVSNARGTTHPHRDEEGVSAAFRETGPDVETATTLLPDVAETTDLAARAGANASASRPLVGSRLARSISGDEAIRLATDTELPATALHETEEVNC